VSSRPPLRARSATEIVDAAFQLFRRDPLPYVLVSALGYAPLLIIQLVVLGPATEIDAQIARLASGYSIVLAFGYWVSISLMSAIIIRLASDDYLGRPVVAPVAVRDAVARLPSVMFGLLFKYILMFFGFLLFLVGTFWVLARYFAVTPAIVLEGRGTVAAFGRSAALSRGQKMHVLGTLLLAFVIFMVIYFAVAIIGAMSGSTVIATVLSTAASIVAYPMFAITEMLLYYDARVRNEGYDIELMAEGLGADVVAGEPR
jgi:hypothetical protein